jgi:hypothetical protein
MLKFPQSSGRANSAQAFYPNQDYRTNPAPKVKPHNHLVTQSDDQVLIQTQSSIKTHYTRDDKRKVFKLQPTIPEDSEPASQVTSPQNHKQMKAIKEFQKHLQRESQT